MAEESSYKRFLWIVIGAVTTLTVGAVSTWVAGIFWSVLSWIWWCLSYSIRFPVSILVVLVIPYIWKIVQRLITPRYQGLYMEDNIRGMIWRWEWSWSEIINLHCLCPQDQMEMRGNNRADGNIFDGPRFWHDFHCERCRYTTCTYEGDCQDTIDFVRKEIRRNINTGEWKNKIPKKTAGRK